MIVPLLLISEISVYMKLSPNTEEQANIRADALLMTEVIKFSSKEHAPAETWPQFALSI